MTYSIVARDARTGELGVAVQSHWPFVGDGVAWAEAGVGAVATQSFVEVSYGPLGLELMRAGKEPAEALSALTSVDELASRRQVGMVDAKGRAAAHTGSGCIREAGHRLGDGYTVHANLMERDTVWDAMAAAFESSDAQLPIRLLDVLDAAEREGGDIRGRQSASILVVSGTPTGPSWQDRTLDARVDDHDQPLEELRRLVLLHHAYDHMERADTLVEEGNLEEALRAYEEARKLEPDAPEIRFWHAITLSKAGRVKEAAALLEDLRRERPQWADLVRRLPAAGELPDDPLLIASLLGTEGKS